MHNLKIIISGPKAINVKIFIDNKAIGLVQSLSATFDANNFIPMFNMSFPALNFQEVDLPVIKDTDIVLSQENIIKFPKDQFGTQFICLGGKPLGCINKLEFSVSITQDVSLVITYPSKDILKKTSFYKYISKQIKKLEKLKFVNIKYLD